MKTIVAFATLVAVALAAPQRPLQQFQLQPLQQLQLQPQPLQQLQLQPQPLKPLQLQPQPLQHGHEAVLVKETPSDNIGLGGYTYGFELSDGQAKEEVAEAVPGGTDGQFLKVRGSFSYVDPATNVAYTVNYIADENGFHPQGDHLPQA